MGLLGSWAKRKEEAQAQAVRDAINDDYGNPSQRTIRQWDDEQLHSRLKGPLSGVSRAFAERELDRRKAWEAPGGRAFYISLAALIVSILALAFSVWAKVS